MRTIQTELTNKGLADSTKQYSDAKQSGRKVKENLDRRDIEELMGVRRSTYKKVKGAFRQK